MVKVPKLKLPLWSELIYFAFVGIVPVVLAGCEIFSSHSSAFKITFSSVGSLLLVIIILKKFVFNNLIKKCQDKIVLLEHDYSIKLGDAECEWYEWAKYNIIVYVFNVIVLILALILSVLFITALTEQLIAFKGAATLIMCSVMAGIVFKAIIFCVMAKRGHSENKSE